MCACACTYGWMCVLVSQFHKLLITYSGMIWTLYVTGFAKSDPNHTRIENRFYRPTLMLHSLALSWDTKNMAKSKSAFTTVFYQPLKPWMCTTWPVEPMGDIKKDMCGTKLLPTTVTQHCCLCPCGRYNLPLAAHPPQLPTPLSSHPPPIHAICNVYYST